MKKCLTILIALLTLLCLSAAAMAAQVKTDVYSDAPANPTQENVLSIEAEITVPGQEMEAYAVATMQPTRLTADTLAQIFDFVNIQENPPARWFPEAVQQQIREVSGVNPDILYMPEFMSLMPGMSNPDASARVQMHFDIDYEPGRLVVVILGWETDEGLKWEALKAQVAAQSLIRFDIPENVLAAIAGRETLFTLLSVRPGSSWQETTVVIEQGATEDETITPYFVFSKSFEDTTRVEDSYIITEATQRGGSEGGEDCQIIIVEDTEPIRAEMARLTQWLSEDGSALMPYFSDEINRQVRLFLPEGADPNALIAYELTHVMVVGYDEPYGDVAAKFSFVTPYEPGQTMVSLIAMPGEDGSMTYTPLHTEYKDGYIEITFSSTVLPAMMEDAGLLLVLSTPLQ